MGSTGVLFAPFFLVSYWPPAISIVGHLTESVCPLFLFIIVVIMIDLFVLDDSLTS